LSLLGGLPGHIGGRLIHEARWARVANLALDRALTAVRDVHDGSRWHGLHFGERTRALASASLYTAASQDSASDKSMRNRITVRMATAIVTLVVSGCIDRQSASSSGTDATLAADVEAFATRLAAGDEFSGVVLLGRHGQTLVRQAYGLADRTTGRLNTPMTPFMLSSVSKMFTAVAIARLVERKQLGFDSTLGSLLPEYPSADARDHVTVHHLLTMSSGIVDLFRVPEFFANVASARSSIDFWKYFATSPLQFRPGAQWGYSNSNFLLLGAIIERRTNRPFTSVLEDEVFRPLGMANTRYEFGGSIKPALGYTRTPPADAGAKSGSWYPAWEEPKAGSECVPCLPMGGGYSTADDLARFADALMGHRILTPEMTAIVLTGHIDAEYGGRDGYGFETRLVNRIRTAGHRGSLDGSSNVVEFYPDLGYVLVILGNTNGGTDAIAAHVRELITS
jgi:D-alanyl-D-alanine carboxypeptidase